MRGGGGELVRAWEDSMGGGSVNNKPRVYK